MNHTMKHNQMLRYLCHIPRKIVALHGNDNVSAFVLHELCHESCFNLPKAAYFVDNPAFDCLKGVAGYYKPEAYQNYKLETMKQFNNYITKSPFQKKVCDFNTESAKRHNTSDKKIISLIAQQLDIHNPEYYCWDMKHDNHGIFVFEREKSPMPQWEQEDLENGIHMLSLCPVH